MEFKEAVGTRRTVRSFQADRPVDRAKIQKILEAARLQSQHGNAQLVRKAVVVTKGETSDEIRNALIEALHNQPRAAQAPVAIVWVQDMAGWTPQEATRKQFLDAQPIRSGDGWSGEFADNIGLAVGDFYVRMQSDVAFAQWLTSFECGLAVGSALLAAVDEGLGTGLISGRREEIRKLFNMPASCTPTHVQLIGYAAEGQEGPGLRKRPEFGELYFADTWGNPLARDPEVVEQLRAAKALRSTGPSDRQPPNEM
jgi:nitroreductase